MHWKLPFRGWFYFRIGWSTYFAFIFAAINTMVTTYYLAIKDIPSLKAIFPSFAAYVGIITAIGIPILIALGYFHYKRSPAYTAEADISAESNPYFYKLPPGYNMEVLFPLYGALTNLLLKMAHNEKLTEEEIKQIQDLQSKIDVLLKGGHVGTPRRKIS